MPLTRIQKENIVKKLEENFLKAKIVVITNYKGTTVEQIQDLRSKLREEGIDFGVFKNTLIKIAAKNAKVKIDESCFGKPLCFAFGKDDEVTPARIIYQFAKEQEKPEILGGILDGKFIWPDQIKTLALIPSKEQLYANLVGSIAAPISGLVYVLKGNLFSLVSVLSQYNKSKAL